MTNAHQIADDQAESLPEQELTVDTINQTESSPFDLNRVVLFDALTASCITQIVVSFDGYGDSGQIEDISVRNGETEIAMPERLVELFDPALPQPEPRRSSVSIASAVETLAYDVLAQTHCGWENNDGAYGDIVFDVGERTITLDYNERYTATEYSTHVL